MFVRTDRMMYRLCDSDVAKDVGLAWISACWHHCCWYVTKCCVEHRGWHSERSWTV